MTKSSWFYWIAGIALAMSVGHALWRTFASMGDGPAPTHYASMAFEERATEYRTLAAEVQNSAPIPPERYFQVLSRMEKLDQAIYRAGQEEQTLDPRIARSIPAEYMRLRSLKNDWVNRFDTEWRKDRAFTEEQFIQARSAAGMDEIQMRPHAPMDPFLPMSLALLYTVGLIFTFGRFCIATEELGGSWVAAHTQMRFFLCLVFWFAGGVFKYPTEVDVKDQVKRAFRRVRRVAAFALTWALSLAGGGCAAKRVNTKPDMNPSNPETTWVMKTNSTTWPSQGVARRTHRFLAALTFLQ